jgi:hypothetical protein
MLLGAADGKELWDSLKNMRPELSKKNLSRVTNDNIVRDLVEFEEKQVTHYQKLKVSKSQLLKEFKVGILYYKEGQRTDNEMYSNIHGNALPIIQIFIFKPNQVKITGNFSRFWGIQFFSKDGLNLAQSSTLKTIIQELTLFLLLGIPKVRKILRKF